MKGAAQEAEASRLEGLGKAFGIYGDFLGGSPYGSGHINATYAVSYLQAGTPVRYIFQKINTLIFQEPEKLMENISRVTTHQRRVLEKKGQASSRRCLQALQGPDGGAYCKEGEGAYWRAYLFIEKAQTYDVILSDAQAFAAAKAFGDFQGCMASYAGPRLHESIPNFHHTPLRFRRLREAIASDPQKRASGCQEEIAGVLAAELKLGQLVELAGSGELPERITHNDTKLNNVMLDDESGEGICVIDLDTVMPGLVAYDFGDMVRTATMPVREDETDLSKVRMQWGRFEALARGYLSSASAFLTKEERRCLAFSGWLMTFEVGIRFLTDYLEGDHYFKIQRPLHNLERCRTQFALAKDIERQRGAMESLIASIS